MRKCSVAHLTSAHPRYDTRIFWKECRSLAEDGYEVNLVVADGRGDEIRDEVSIWDTGRSLGRLARMFYSTRRVYRKAIHLDADIYHLHDPELILVGIKLKKHGKKVIFDAHEDVPRQLLSKPYLNPFLRRLLSGFFGYFERWACRHFDGVVAATPFIKQKFSRINSTTVDVNNFPIIDELVTDDTSSHEKKDQVCYVGGISSTRGIRELVHAMEHLRSNVRLQLAGVFSESALESEIRAYNGWERVDELGWLNRAEIRDVLGRSVAGIVTLHPIINYIDALPVKMFEYMSAGVPVISSDFPLWCEIIEGQKCGICVNPLDPVSIAEAIDYLVAHPEIAAEMGRNGQLAVKNIYNWDSERKKLLEIYLKINGGVSFNVH